MAQKKTAAAKIARKAIKVPARQAAPLLEAAKAVKVVEKPAEIVASAQSRQAPSARASSTRAPSTRASSTRTNTPSNDLDDLAVVGRENLEACVKCGTIAAKGVESLGTEVMSFTQASIEADLAAAKDIMAAKTLHEAIDLQTSFVQARLERMTSETTKLGELSLQLASLAMEPLRRRFDANTRANTWTVFRPMGL